MIQAWHQRVTLPRPQQAAGTVASITGIRIRISTTAAGTLSTHQDSVIANDRQTLLLTQLANGSLRP